MQNKPTILSGIQPSGKLHIGNFLGALSNFVNLQNSSNYECFYVLVDYHSIVADYKPEEKQKQILDLAVDFLASGIDPKKSTLFVQSHLPEHTELMWILNCITPVSELQRMTQFKDKSQKQEKNINMGLFDYPVLQASDILLYKPSFVPVGMDQKQHLELTNVLARKFNNRFGEYFSEIAPLWTNFPKVMDLKEPNKKMSKSSPMGCIFLDDAPAEILEKLKKATTATEAGQKSPGEENLLNLLSHFGSADEINYFHEAQKTQTLKYSELKETLAKNIANHFAEFREKKQALLSKPKEIKEILLEGAKQAKLTASKTLQEVKQKIGLL
jgi:tryptophanyl-tRNA synthetase